MRVAALVPNLECSRTNLLSQPRSSPKLFKDKGFCLHLNWHFIFLGNVHVGELGDK